MEQPIVGSPDRDAAMPARMAGKRNHQHLVARPGYRAHGREAEPGFALFLDRRPFLDRGDLRRPVAQALVQARPGRGGAKLGGEDMHRRGGEIADPSRMVRIEMGRHDVANVAWTIAHVRHLPQRRLRDLEARARRRVEHEPESPRLGDVLDAEPGVDQDQPVIALDQEAMAGHGRGGQRSAGAAEHLPAAWTQRSAIEVMDAHPPDPPTGLIGLACHRSVVGVHLKQPQDCTIIG